MASIVVIPDRLFRSDGLPERPLGPRIGRVLKTLSISGLTLSDIPRLIFEIFV